jgi:hypothetical protein
MPKLTPTRDRPAAGDLPPELERRIAAIERIDDAGEFNATSWFWLLLFGIAVPAALLLWGWRA